MALWSLLVFAVSIGLPTLSICGDSQVIINWEKSVACLDVVDLEHWCDRITDVKSDFLSINIQHIYREHNMSANVYPRKHFLLRWENSPILRCWMESLLGAIPSYFFKLCYSTYLLWLTHIS